MSTGGSITHTQFKEYQLDHLIDVILDAGGDPDHAAEHVADLYPTDNVQDYINITEMDLSALTLTKSNNIDGLTLPSALKRRILSTKGFWQNWGDNSMQDWTVLSLDNFEEYLVTNSGPNALLQTTTAPTTAMDVMAITNAVSVAMLAKPPTSCIDLFNKNKGGGDNMKPLKEPKQWNTWQWTFLSIAHSYDFMDITDVSYSLDSLDHDEVKVFELKQKHAFTILVANVKEPSVLPIIRKYADSNATHYGNAQLLYYDIVAHYTQGLTG